eukprot:216461_1
MAQIDNNDSNETKQDDNDNANKIVSIDHTISDVQMVDIPNGKSKFVSPKRMKFKQNGKDRIWDLVEAMSAVAALCYHVEKRSFLFVKQFRPPLYYNYLQNGTLKQKEDKHKDNKGHQVGCTVECIAGLLDKPELSPLQTMHEELKEEVGYEVPLESIEFITNYTRGVGILGATTAIYYAKIDESMKISEGGGCTDDNELIEKIWIPVKDSSAFVLQNDELPPGLKFAVFWFYHQYPELCKELNKSNDK